MKKNAPRETLLGSRLKEALGTQYGNHTGYDAQECLEKMTPHSTIGIPKGDRNRGFKGRQN